MDNKKITLEQLIARKQQGERDKLKYKDMETPIGVLTVKKLPLTSVLRMMDSMGKNPNTSESVELEKELIYKSCPIMQDKKLQEAYADEIVEPYDIVTAAFDDNVSTLSDITDKIFEFYGLNNAEVEKEVKN